MWTCDLCGSEKVQQQFSVMLPMNEGVGRDGGSALNDLYADDYYFCEDCQSDCHPIKSYINSLHKDYEPE